MNEKTVFVKYSFICYLVTLGLYMLQQHVELPAPVSRFLPLVMSFFALIGVINGLLGFFGGTFANMVGAFFTTTLCGFAIFSQGEGVVNLFSKSAINSQAKVVFDAGEDVTLEQLVELINSRINHCKMQSVVTVGDRSKIYGCLQKHFERYKKMLIPYWRTSSDLFDEFENFKSLRDRGPIVSCGMMIDELLNENVRLRKMIKASPNFMVQQLTDAAVSKESGREFMKQFSSDKTLKFDYQLAELDYVMLKELRSLLMFMNKNWQQTEWKNGQRQFENQRTYEELKKKLGKCEVLIGKVKVERNKIRGMIQDSLLDI